MVLQSDKLAQPLPISTAHEEEQLKFWRAAVDEQIANLAPEKRGMVEQACEALGLGTEATRTALATTIDLIDFERYGRDLVLTDAQRFEALKYVRDAARGIADAIGDLPIGDRIALELGARSAGIALGLQRERLMSPLGFSALAVAAQRLIDARPDDEGKGGRRPLRAEYSRFVSSLADSFDLTGLPVGRGGAFERLCAVVFDAAGVRATPEGAIRYYLSERKKQSENKPENSSGEAAE